MNEILRSLKKKQPFFFTLATVGPLLLLSNRLVYTLSLSLILCLYIVFILLLRLLLEKFLDWRLWFSVELFVAALLIASIDIILTAYLPLLRADMGILLPFILFQGQAFLAIAYPPISDNEVRFREREKTGRTHVVEVCGGLFGYIVMLLLLSLVRELLSYGAISLNIYPWDAGGGAATGIVLFSSVFGLLLLFAAIYMLQEKE